jgi:hypothetical protein
MPAPRSSETSSLGSGGRPARSAVGWGGRRFFGTLRRLAVGRQRPWLSRRQHERLSTEATSSRVARVCGRAALDDQLADPG